MDVRHLLVTTDLSADSECALATAGSLARDLGARATLLTVLDFDPGLPPGVLSLSPDREAAVKQEVRQKVGRRMMELAEAHLSGLSPSVVVEEGSGAARTICEFAKDHAVDLLVISTHGRTGLRRLLIGSVTEHVMRCAPCPVLTVRPRP